MSKLSEALDAALEEIADLRDLLENAGSVELARAHVEYSFVEYPGLTVSLDAAGNAMRVDFEGPGWGVGE